MARVIVLGAKGRFGRAAVVAFKEAGWEVTSVARAWPASVPDDHVTADAEDADALTAACAGHDVIVNAVHPPYTDWARAIPAITEAVITAARATGATVMIPGNLYNYGVYLPARLREDTPWAGNTRKGAIRIRMESAYRDAAVPTIVLRGGDFLEGARTGNWFDSYIANKAGAGKLTYPGPRDVVHAWAYLPDLARAMVGLAERRDQFDTFEEFGFGGYALTGDELVALVEKTMGRKMKVKRFPWFALQIMSLWSPLIREVREMRYLWLRPHAVDGTKLRATLPEFQQTPVEVAIATSLAEHTDSHGARTPLM